MSEIIFLVEEADEGGFTAQALGSSIFTEADSWDELKKAAHEAVMCHFDPAQLPKMIRLHLVRDELVTV